MLYMYSAMYYVQRLYIAIEPCACHAFVNGCVCQTIVASQLLVDHMSLLPHEPTHNKLAVNNAISQLSPKIQLSYKIL